jgi:hypothetical protein
MQPSICIEGLSAAGRSTTERQVWCSGWADVLVRGMRPAAAGQVAAAD